MFKLGVEMWETWMQNPNFLLFGKIDFNVITAGGSNVNDKEHSSRWEDAFMKALYQKEAERWRVEVYEGNERSLRTQCRYEVNDEFSEKITM